MNPLDKPPLSSIIENPSGRDASGGDLDWIGGAIEVIVEILGWLF